MMNLGIWENLIAHFVTKLEDSDEKPQDRLAKYYLCCDCQDIINDNGMLVCLSCGIEKDMNRRQNMSISMRIDTK